MIVGSRNGLWPGSRSQSQTDSQWRTRMLDWLQTSRCVQGRRTHLWDSLKPMQITRNLRLAALAAPMSHKQSSRDAHRPFPHTTIIAFAILLSAFAVVASPKLCPLCTKVPQSRAPFVLSLGIARLSRLPKTAYQAISRPRSSVPHDSRPFRCPPVRKHDPPLQHTPP